MSCHSGLRLAGLVIKIDSSVCWGCLYWVSGTWEKGIRSVVVFEIVACGVFNGVRVKGLLIDTVLVSRLSHLGADDFVLKS